MKDIIWITFRGRHIPIKPGMKGKFNKKKLEDIKNKRIKKGDTQKYKDLSIKENYEEAQDDLVLNKGKSVEESEKMLGRYEDLYAKSEEGKQYTSKLKEVQSKIDKLEDKKTIKVDGRDVKITGSNTDYEKNEELKSLYQEKRSYEDKIQSAGRRGSRATLSEYYRYFLDMGYSKETALKYAEEQIRKRKSK